MKYNCSAALMRQFVSGAILIGAALCPRFAQAAAPTSTDAPGNPAANPTSPPDATDTATKMSPFLISDQNDVGYQGEQTLAGSRTSKYLLDIPADIKIINKQMIDDLNGTSTQAVLQYSVAEVTPNTGFQDDLQFRGFRTNGALRDGVPASPGVKESPMYDVSRVEVITGPAAMLLGGTSGNAIGGVVNLISVAPTAKAAGEVDATFGERGYVRGQVNSTGPLYQDKDVTVLYRATLGGLTGDREKSIETLNEKFYGGALTFLFGPNTSLYVSGFFFQNQDYNYYDDFLDITGPTPSITSLVPAKLNQYSTASFSPFDKAHAFMHTNSSFFDMTLLQKLTANANLRLYYAHAGLTDHDQYLRGITVLSDDTTLLRNVIPESDGRSFDYFQVDFSHQLDLRYAKFSTELGGDGQSLRQITQSSVLAQANGVLPLNTAAPNYAADAAFFASPYPGNGLPNTSNSETLSSNKSLYVQETGSILKDRLSIVGGLRWFDPWSESTNNITHTTTIAFNQKTHVYKYGAVLKPFSWLSLYYTNAENLFPQSGPTDLYTSGDNLGPPLKNQRGTNREFGLKVDYPINDRLSVYGSVAHFDMALTNVRILGTLADGQFGVTQDAENSSAGWDATAGAHLKLDGATVEIVLSGFNGESHVAGDPYSVQATGFSPRNYTFFGKYMFTSGMLRGFRVGGGIADRSTYRSSNYLISPSVFATAFAGYEVGRHWDTQLNLDNLTNKRSILGVAANGLAETTDPFEARLQIKYKW